MECKEGGWNGGSESGVYNRCIKMPIGSGVDFHPLLLINTSLCRL